MADSYNLVTEYKGYINKADITNVAPEYLVPPSQNVLINDANKVAIRGGYTLVGAASSTSSPVLSAYDWKTSTGTEFNFRKYGTTLEYWYNDTWNVLDTASLFTATSEIQFAPWWSTAEAKDLLLMVDGTSNIYMWSGGVTTFASAAATTLTKEGTNTWAQDRFLVAGTRSVKIGSTTYTYTGGEGTTTLTGVSPDPTLGGHTAGDRVYQTIRTTATTPGAAVSNDIIAVARNQVYIADFSLRDVYVSKNSDYTLYTFSTPRLPGEGALLTLDSPPIGFAIQEEDVYISSNDSDWYKTSFTLSSDLTKEKLDIKKLKTGTGQGAYSQGSIAQAKNNVIYFSNEKVIDSLGRVENIDTPQSLPLSDSIKLELLSYDLTVAPDSIYFRNQTWFTFPSVGKQLIYDHARGYWMPPQTFPIRKFAIIDGNLCGHSNATPETYQLLNGTNDNTFAINAIAAFPYRNYGKRAIFKDFDEWYTEGYIRSNTTLTLTLNYEYGGSRGIIEKDIEGDDDTILFGSSIDNSLGKNHLGSLPIGTTTDAEDLLVKFRTNALLRRKTFFEIQPVYSSNEIDYQWELLATGPNIAASTVANTAIQA